jgi:hypothetical protein
MPVIVGNGTIEGGSSTFTVKDSSGTAVYAQGISGNSGFTNNANVPAFIAGSATDPSWVLVGTNAWAKVNQYAAVTSYNRGNHYSTANTRFTAPITGPYLFIWTTYCYTNNYFHPQFAVNGNVATRRYDTPYKIRNHGWTADYQCDAQIEEVIYLIAGDYVEVYHYAGGTAYTYPYYCLFQGLYVG